MNKNEVTPRRAWFECMGMFGILWLGRCVLQFPIIDEWSRAWFRRDYPDMVWMIGVAAAWLLFAKIPRSTCALTLSPLSYQADLSLRLLIPTGLSIAIVYSFMEPDLRTWRGPFLWSLVHFLLFAWFFHRLRRLPDPGEETVETTGKALTAVVLFSLSPRMATAYSAMFFILCFRVPAEELFFRGLIQGRFNQAYGRRHRLGGVMVGRGWLVSALFFALYYLLLDFNPFVWHFTLHGWWGIMALSNGLLCGYVREKSGSLLPPYVLNAVPHAVAWAVLAM